MCVCGQTHKQIGKEQKHLNLGSLLQPITYKYTLTHTERTPAESTDGHTDIDRSRETR